MSNLIGKSYHKNCQFWKNGPKWLNLKSFNLLESRLLRGREESSLLVHALSHFRFLTSLPTFLFSFFFVYPFRFSLLSIPLFFLYFPLFFLVLLLLFTVHSWDIFILLVVIRFTVLPLNYFWLGVGVLPGPPTGLLAT